MSNKISTNVYSQKKPSWLTDNEDVGYDADFWRIINFYVLHSLCMSQNYKGITLQSTFSWDKSPWNNDNYLKNKILSAIWDGEEPHIYMSDRKGFKSKHDNLRLEDKIP